MVIEPSNPAGIGMSTSKLINLGTNCKLLLINLYNDVTFVNFIALKFNVTEISVEIQNGYSFFARITIKVQ